MQDFDPEYTDPVKRPERATFCPRCNEEIKPSTLICPACQVDVVRARRAVSEVFRPPAPVIEGTDSTPTVRRGTVVVISILIVGAALGVWMKRNPPSSLIDLHKFGTGVDLTKNDHPSPILPLGAPGRPYIPVSPINTRVEAVSYTVPDPLGFVTVSGDVVNDGPFDGCSLSLEVIVWAGELQLSQQLSANEGGPFRVGQKRHFSTTFRTGGPASGARAAVLGCAKCS